MHNKLTTSLLVLTLTAAMAALLPLPARAADAEPQAPYVTSPDYVVDKMLELGQVGPGDYVIDLGSGTVAS